MRFRTVVELGGKTATGMRVPREVVAELGHGQRPPVHVTINGHTYRSTIAAYNGVFMLPLSAENRQASGVAAGDEVDVDVALDTEPREVKVPADLNEALDAQVGARPAWEALSYSNKLRHVLSVEGAKAPETRRRRIDKVVASLLEEGR